MANKVEDKKHENQFEREGEQTSTRVIWHQIAVRHSSVWHPPTDVYRTTDRLVVIIEIAGMREDDLQIVLNNRELTVSGSRQQLTNGEAEVAYHQMEIERGAFRTVIHLPWNTDRSRVSAVYRDGLLKIELPRLEAATIRVLNMPPQNPDEA